MTTITKDQMILHEGEVYVISNDKTSIGDYGINILASNPEPRVCRFENSFDFKDDFQDIRKVTHSTAKLNGMIHLNREWFVRGEDVEEMAEKWTIEKGIKGAGVLVTDNSPYRSVKEIWKAGYNAKKGEFTREQMEKAMRLAFVSGSTDGTMSITDILNLIHPIILPKSLTLNKDNEIVKIEW